MVTADVVGVDGPGFVVKYEYETAIAGRKQFTMKYPANVCCVVPSDSDAESIVTAPLGTPVLFYHPENKVWCQGKVARHCAAPGALDPARPPAANPAFNDIVSMWQGDITTLDVDGIQNAANEGLRSGGGICGAIFSAAGEFDLQRACFSLHPLLDGGDPENWGGERCMIGDTKVTPGCGLHARNVLHTVGPRGEKPALLEAAYRSALDAAVASGMESVALCCISTGIFGYPPEAAAPLAVATVRTWLEERCSGTAGAASGAGRAKTSNGNASLGGLRRIIFCLFLDQDVSLYRYWMSQWFPRGA
jgi:O-acetyl-ADP-ribose deacetylase (regulator of RNase III)